MEEYGQPMHAYDLDTLAGHQIVVKNAQDGQRVAAAGFFFGKAFQLEHHPDGVFIDGVGVKQVELHKSTSHQG